MLDREVNKAYITKVAGIPREEIIGKTLLEISKKISENFLERLLQEIGVSFLIFNEWAQQDMEVMKSGGTRTDEQELIFADGTNGTKFKLRFNVSEGNCMRFSNSIRKYY